jgi:carboxyl-terminal processing protease
MKSRSLPLIVLPLLTLFIGWQLGQNYERANFGGMQPPATSASGTVMNDPEREANISMLWSVWRLLMNKYVHPEQLTTDKMVYGAIRGLVASVGDPYTLFMTPQENTEFHNVLDGHLDGIGAQMTLKEGHPVVMGIIKGSPAEKAGLLPQDMIITVDGKSLDNQTLDQIVGQIRGKKGTTVTLIVLRADEIKTRTFTIVRDTIRVPSTEYKVNETAHGNVGVLTINEFGGSTISDIQSTLQTEDMSKLKGLIVDLRFNGGGYLEGAVALTSMFVKEGTVVTVAGRSDDEVHSVTGNPVLPDLPVVILINEGSASASEIFAGAMKDYDRATLIGMKSFGKGTVQEIVDLPGGASLRVTVARWLTPKGTDIGKVGIMPDIIVDRTVDDFKANKDPQLQAAIEVLTQGKVMTVKTGTGATK